MKAEDILINALNEYKQNHELETVENEWIDTIIKDTEDGYFLYPLRQMIVSHIRGRVKKEDEKEIVDSIIQVLDNCDDFWDTLDYITEDHLSDYFDE